MLFAGFGASAFISLSPAGSTRGIGIQITVGLAYDTETKRFKLFESVGRACTNNPSDKVTGVNLGAGGVVGQVEGNFKDFFGEATEETFTVGPLSRTDITTATGKKGVAVAGGGRGFGLSGTVIRTKTAPTSISALLRGIINTSPRKRTVLE